MSSFGSPNNGLSRRSLIRAAGFGTAAIAIGGAGALTPRRAYASESPLAAVADYLGSRAAAADPKRAATSLKSSSSRLARYELERGRYIRALGQRFDWDGHLLDLTSTPSEIQVVEQDASRAVVRLYEQTTVNWVPNPRKKTAEFRALQKAQPGKYGLGIRQDRVVATGFGTEHELTVEKSTSGWAVVTDAYAEPSVFGSSPDVAGSEYLQELARTANRQTADPETETTAIADFAQLATTQHTFNWQAAVDYAKKYWSSYNSAYVNYNQPCSGGDCANFVSQCFFAGAQTITSTWSRSIGSQCGYTNRYRGTTAWVNNWSLRNWVINSGRGQATTLQGIGTADIINYDWDQNGTYSHVAIVTDPVNNLVTAHNNNHYNYPWQLGDTSCNHTFTTTYPYFQA